MKSINLEDGKKHVVFMVDSHIAQTTGLPLVEFIENAGNTLSQALEFCPALQNKIAFHASIDEDRITFQYGSERHLFPSADNFLKVVGEHDAQGAVQTGTILSAVEKISEAYGFNPVQRPIFIFLTDKPLMSLTRFGNVYPYGHSQINTYAIVSTQPFQRGSHMTSKEQSTFLTVLTHEFGHVFGAEKDRTDTRNDLGAHCTCSSCVMQQSSDFTVLSDIRKARVNLGKSPYCDACCASIIQHAALVTGQSETELKKIDLQTRLSGMRNTSHPSKKTR